MPTTFYDPRKVIPNVSKIVIGRRELGNMMTTTTSKVYVRMFYKAIKKSITKKMPRLPDGYS